MIHRGFDKNAEINRYLSVVDDDLEESVHQQDPVRLDG